MTGLSALVAGPWGTPIAIAGMALVTYLCRVGGVLVMSRLNITPRVERGLRALPGSIIVATITPLVIDDGINAVVSILVTVTTMLFTRLELVALIAGLAALSLLRAFGI